MNFEHIAIWVNNLELMRLFYQKFFGMISGEKYENNLKGFSSYFLTFKGAKTRLELMHKSDIKLCQEVKGFTNGIAHLAISVGSKEKVNSLVEKLKNDGYIVYCEPRVTGDGYYESVILDPEGNQIEIVE